MQDIEIIIALEKLFKEKFQDYKGELIIKYDLGTIRIESSNPYPIKEDNLIEKIFELKKENQSLLEELEDLEDKNYNFKLKINSMKKLQDA